MVERIRNMPDDEWETYCIEQFKLVEQRLEYYEEHTVRMDMVRRKYSADLIVDGVIEDSPGFRASEFHFRDGISKRIPHNEKQFTDNQMALALKSLDVKPEPIESWL